MSKENTSTAGERTHTPGPWKIKFFDEHNGNFEILGGDCFRIYICEGDLMSPPAVAAAEANASLIAAAPVLLEACRKAATTIGSDEARFKESMHEAVIEVLSEINAAIASAEWK